MSVVFLLDNDPEFTSIPATETISNSVSIGTTVATLAVDDIDTYDVSSLAVTMITVNSDYSFDTTTRKFIRL